ncbi:MAG: NRDE family protein [Myxococcales bacterium]|nr:NRDE family protein [Myxococcales bacterium]MCB9544716.1 NRDE family protein [Myxococcales bacterium]
MCTFLVGRGTDPRWPLVIAANRDEFYGRRSTGPQVLVDAPRVVGGRDLVAGGTWLGVRPDGFFAGLTNEPRPPGPAAARSRGEVVLEVLRRGADARAWLEALDPADFLPFNLLFGDAAALSVAYGRPGEAMAFAAVPPGFHVLPNGVLDTPTFPKVARAQALVDGTLESLEAALADAQTPTGLPPPPPHLPADVFAAVHRLCVRTPLYGTVSASSVALVPGGVARYRYAPGAPDEVSFLDHTALVTASPGEH